MSEQNARSAVRSRLWVRIWATTAFVLLLGGQAVRNLVGYWAYSGIAIAMFLVTVRILMATRPEWRWRRLPKSLFAFLIFGTLSLAWSAYPGGTAIGVATQWMSAIAALALALCLSWTELVRTLSAALRWLLALSIAFEAWVSLALQHPLLPLYIEASGPVPKAFYWSRNLLLSGGPIDGVVGNRNLLGFIALVAVIVFSVQLAERTVRRGWGIAWLVLAMGTLALTRSATVSVVAVLVALGAAIALWARSRPEGQRGRVALVAVLGAAITTVFLLFGRGVVLDALGRSEDLTGRLDIWSTVGAMFSERPLVGWGWIGYWLPWEKPFDALAVKDGVVYLQAHNAWLDVAMQLGFVGLAVFAALVGSTLWRSWFLAVDRPIAGLSASAPYRVNTLLPWLLMVALIGQSFAESRLLIEGNFVLLVIVAAVTKKQQWREAELT